MEAGKRRRSEARVNYARCLETPEMPCRMAAWAVSPSAVPRNRKAKHCFYLIYPLTVIFCVWNDVLRLATGDGGFGGFVILYTAVNGGTYFVFINEIFFYTFQRFSAYCLEVINNGGKNKKRFRIGNAGMPLPVMPVSN
ncbi:MAG: hypothetical protein LBK13_02360 [Spirochaetales bacterium]|nr:hypothetical protein [Spirochaetales bacterium]